MSIEIEELTAEYTEAAKDLLAELQAHIAALDNRGVIVLKENFRDDYFKFVTEEVKKHSGKIFVAVMDRCAVGIVICKIFQEIDNERGKGIGKALLAHAEKFFKDSGCEYTQLEVFAHNTRAFELYKKSGFEPRCIYMSKKC